MDVVSLQKEKVASYFPLIRALIALLQLLWTVTGPFGNFWISGVTLKLCFLFFFFKVLKLKVVEKEI